MGAPLVDIHLLHRIRQVSRWSRSRARIRHQSSSRERERDWFRVQRKHGAGDVELTREGMNGM